MRPSAAALSTPTFSWTGADGKSADLLLLKTRGEKHKMFSEINKGRIDLRVVKEKSYLNPHGPG
jgi:hypothetical protein